MRISTWRQWGGLLVILLGLSAGDWTGQAQGTRSDYERADQWRERTRNKVFRQRVEPHWLGDDARFWYRVEVAENAEEYRLVDARAGERRPLFNANALAQALVEATHKPVEPQQLGLEKFEVDGAAETASFRHSGSWWQLDLRSAKLSRIEKPSRGGTPQSLPKASRRTGPEMELTFVNRTDGPLAVYWLDPDGERRSYGTVPAAGQRRQHTFGGHVWLLIDTAERTLAWVEADPSERTIEVGPDTQPIQATVEGSAPASASAGLSPDRRYRVFVLDDNLWLEDRLSHDVTALTTSGTRQDRYGHEVFWSPDSTRLVALQTQPVEERKIHLIESSPANQLQPVLRTLDYAKPGDPLPTRRPRLFEIPSGKELPVDGSLFTNAWSLDEFRWAPDSREFTFVFNQRGHQTMRVLAIDAQLGTLRAIVEETSPTFIDYAHKHFLHWIEERRELIWMSERDGWNHLYLYDTTSGAVKHQITRGSWVVRSVVHVDAERRVIWFRAGAIVPGQDPYQEHFVRVNFDGSGLVVLTQGDGHHQVSFSPQRSRFLDTWSRVDAAPVTELRDSTTGQLVCEVERADTRALSAAGWRAPERFVAKGRDGATDIYGVILRPSSFEPGRRYPVIENIYAGPQGAFVPKSFQPFLSMQVMAELGFVVVQIDGMGTSGRSKAFHDVCWKNLGDAGFPDRILWLKAAAAKYPELDLDRVGIYGGSAGGQNALRALLAHGDFYKVGVADCGCHDNRMDKIWWNELWMGWPIGPHYAEQSNVTQAHRLQGKLLLTVGELDQNVDPASTLQVVNALIKANKEFELLVVPGAGHGVGESSYAARRRQDFFVRHLWGAEPRR